VPTNVRLLSAQRSYEYPPDALKLSIITLQDVVQRLAQSHGFQVAQVATPMPTFGPILPTIPPGLVLNLGFVPVPEGSVTPIRFLHFEQSRIVVDVAGHSSAIDAIFQRIEEMFEDVRAPDGSPVIGKHKRVRNRSEITAQLSFPQDLLLPDVIRHAVSATASRGSGLSETALLPMVATQILSLQAEYPGFLQPNPDAYVLEPRAGTGSNDHVYYSAAPLVTDTHLAMIETIEAGFTQRRG